MFVFESIHPRPDGSRRQVRRRGFPTKSAAQSALDRARSDDRGLLNPGGSLTVGDLLDRFLRAKELAGRAPSTLEQFRWAAGRIRERWGGWPADRLTPEVIDEGIELLTAGRKVHRRGEGTTATEKPLSARSAGILLKVLRASYALAVDRGDVLRNPAALAVVPKVGEQHRPWWTPEQVGAFLTFVQGRDDLPLGLVETLADTGARRGDVLALRWEDLDLEAGTATITRQLVAHPRTRALSIRPTKRPRSHSTIGLHPATVTVLRRRRTAQHAERLAMGAGWPAEGLAVGLVFTRCDGLPIHPEVLTRTIQRPAAAADLPRIGAHGLRHSSATAALAARVPVEVVAARLGNTPRMVVEVYAHVIPADDAGAALLVGDLYRSPAAERL